MLLMLLLQLFVAVDVVAVDVIAVAVVAVVDVVIGISL